MTATGRAAGIDGDEFAVLDALRLGAGQQQQADVEGIAEVQAREGRRDHRRQPARLVLAVPLADLAWVVILRTRLGKPFYLGDTNHLSHRLNRAGLNRTRAVLLLWLVATADRGLPLADGYATLEARA